MDAQPVCQRRELVKEPYRSQFAQLIRRGAGTLDIHDAEVETSFTMEIEAPDVLIQREVERVELHRNSLVPLLESMVGPVERVLDFGCGTGATTVAIAMSRGLGAREVIGLDPNERSLEAAVVRARGYGLPAERCSFRAIGVGQDLPYDNESFDLVTCVSVIEYVHRLEDRRTLVGEFERVTRRGGHVVLVTPSPFRVRDYHTQRILGDWRRADGYPWASPPWQLARLFTHSELIPARARVVEHGLRRRGVPVPWLPQRAAALLGWALPWQKIVARRR
jgi:ubiquinone/menaquinone biosynthesis C-methylase UbiE